MPNFNDNEQPVLWGGTGSRSLNSAARFTSDAVIISPDAVQGALQVTVDNSGTPASGDVVDVYIAWSVDGLNYDTEEHAQWLCRLDTFGSNDPGEDPARATRSLNVSAKQGFKVVARAPQGATRPITLSAVYNPHLMS